MGSLFKTPKAPKMPEAPKPVRMPFEQDPEVLAAGERERKRAAGRSGRMSTILTDQTAAIGSSGQKLGG